MAAPHTRSAASFKLDLLRAVSFNVLIGNGEAHSKNYSVLIRETGEVMLAPLYDAAPTLLLYARSSNAGHSVAGQARLNYITLDHLVREAGGWGVDAEVARSAVSELFTAARRRCRSPSRSDICRHLSLTGRRIYSPEAPPGVGDGQS